jgi:hypothetical protein
MVLDTNVASLKTKPEAALESLELTNDYAQFLVNFKFKIL